MPRDPHTAGRATDRPCVSAELSLLPVAAWTAAFDGEEIYGLIADNFDGFGVPNTLWLYENNIAEFAQPTRYFEFYYYGDGTTVALDFASRDPDGECALAETHAGGWAEYVESVDGDFGSFFLELVRETQIDG